MPGRMLAELNVACYEAVSIFGNSVVLRSRQTRMPFSASVESYALSCHLLLPNFVSAV